MTAPQPVLDAPAPRRSAWLLGVAGGVLVALIGNTLMGAEALVCVLLALLILAPLAYRAWTGTFDLFEPVVLIAGGYDKGTYGEGNYSLLLGNIITSGAHRAVTEGPRGALTMGVDNSGRMTTMIGNIVAHLADPDNPAELTAKPVTADLCLGGV